MRALFTAVVLFVFINALALGGLFAWLAGTGRLDKARADQVIELFKPTIAEQTQLEAEVAAAEEEARKVAEQAIRMEQVANGPVTPQMRLDRIEEVSQHQRQLVERRKVEIQAIQRQLDLTRSQVDAKIDAFDQRQQAFQAAVQERLQQFEDEDFRQAVALLEGLPPRQGKELLQAYLQQGKQGQVVNYLAAMQTRLATKVLKEFKEPREVEQA
ncbi:MAG: hypothetical protein AAGC44_11285, partial [Planctomycetota bacterium]